jgi:hypothetical protein
MDANAIWALFCAFLWYAGGAGWVAEHESRNGEEPMLSFKLIVITAFPLIAAVSILLKGLDDLGSLVSAARGTLRGYGVRSWSGRITCAGVLAPTHVRCLQAMDPWAALST